jgi:hypothetical protein
MAREFLLESFQRHGCMLGPQPDERANSFARRAFSQEHLYSVAFFEYDNPIAQHKLARSARSQVDLSRWHLSSQS